MYYNRFNINEERNIFYRFFAGGRYGILVRPEDPGAIAEALLRVLSDGGLQETLSSLSFERAQDFSLDASLSKWEKIILGGQTYGR